MSTATVLLMLSSDVERLQHLKDYKDGFQSVVRKYSLEMGCRLSLRFGVFVVVCAWLVAARKLLRPFLPGGGTTIFGFALKQKVTQVFISFSGALVCLS